MAASVVRMTDMARASGLLAELMTATKPILARQIESRALEPSGALEVRWPRRVGRTMSVTVIEVSLRRLPRTSALVSTN